MKAWNSTFNASSKPMKRSEMKPRVKPTSGILRTANLNVTSKPTLAYKPRTRKCAICRTPFKAVDMRVKWCSPDCGVAVAQRALEAKRKKEQQAERAETKRKLEQHKPLEYWLKIAERHCNAYIRARDPDICISCGVTRSSAWQAGHYISVGANRTLRFNEDNIHKQCIHCNMHKASNATQYRIRLIEKIGVERVEYLESWHSPIKMTVEAAKEIAETYKARLKALPANRNLMGEAA